MIDPGEVETQHNRADDSGVAGGQPAQRVLYLVVCGSPASRDAGKLVDLAQDAGWTVCVIATPSGLRFIDVDALAARTGYPVRSEYKDPDAPDVLPPPTAIVVAPATVNTVNKWAAGICDTLALGLLVEAIGLGLPVAAMPFSNWAHAAHPAFVANIERLRSWGVRVLFGDDVYPLHDPRYGESHLDKFPWHLALQALEA